MQYDKAEQTQLTQIKVLVTFKISPTCRDPGAEPLKKGRVPRKKPRDKLHSFKLNDPTLKFSKNWE